MAATTTIRVSRTILIFSIKKLNMVQDTQVLNKQGRNEIEGGEREGGNSIEEHLVI